MYVNIGGETLIDTGNIVGFFDIDRITVYKVNRNYLSKTEKSGKIINITDKIPKSFVVCEKNSENIVYISPLNTATLQKRITHKTKINGGI